MGSCGCFVFGVFLLCAVGCFDALFCERLVLLSSDCGLVLLVLSGCMWLVFIGWFCLFVLLDLYFGFGLI